MDSGLVAGRTSIWFVAASLCVLSGCDSSGSSGSAAAPNTTTAARAAGPSVDFAASNNNVSRGGSVTLSWSSQGAEKCEAGAGWTGVKATQGQETVGPLQSTTEFSLSCSGVSGAALRTVTVRVAEQAKPVVLEWRAPTETTTGGVLTDLVGFELYWGSVTGVYDDSVSLDAEARSYQPNLPSGRYYFAITALDSDGEESELSNEVVKIVP